MSYWYRWRLHVWKRRLAFRLIDKKAQRLHPISGRYVATTLGVKANTADIERLVAVARHHITAYLCRLGHIAVDDMPKAKVVE